MYKKANAGAQDRTDRQALVGHINEHGIDPGVFNSLDQLNAERLRDQLVLDKKKLEAKCAELKRKIGDANAVYKGYRRGFIIPTSVFRGWSAEIEQGKRKILQIEEQLNEYKDHYRQRNIDADIERQKRFERIFFEMARELLATPIYERILNATLHRVGEDHLNGPEPIHN
jgi:hypothetical protein